MNKINIFFLFFFILSYTPLTQGFDSDNEDDFAFILSKQEQAPTEKLCLGIASTLPDYYLPKDTGSHTFEGLKADEHPTYHYCALCEPQIDPSLSKSIIQHFPKLFRDTLYHKTLSASEMFQMKSFQKIFGTILGYSHSSQAVSNFLGIFFETPAQQEEPKFLRCVYAGDSQCVIQKKDLPLKCSPSHRIQPPESLYNQRYYYQSENINYLTHFDEEGKAVIDAIQHGQYMLNHNYQLIRTYHGISNLSLDGRFSSACDMFSQELDGSERFIILATYAFWNYIAPGAAIQIVEREISKKHIVELNPTKIAQALLDEYAALFQNSNSRIKVTPPEIALMVILFPFNLWNHRKQDITMSMSTY